MRIVYLLGYLNLNYAFRFYFRSMKTLNSPKEFYGRTIYVSNHPSSFMDPLMVAGLRRPIVFFLVRSDIFKPLLRPFLWAAHSLPIYRQQDGVDTKEKNEQVFRRCIKILAGGRNLLIFGEGFTDDVFIRRLKPIKKGPARIGFTALEKWNWEKKLYIAGVGNNYSDPNYLGGSVIVSTSDKILLNDYKDLYLENPAKAILEVTKEIENKIKEQIVHVEDAKMAPTHEKITRLTRMGLHPIDRDSEIDLKVRLEYSQKLANWMNMEENLEKTLEIQKDVELYFNELVEKQIPERCVYQASIQRLSGAKQIFFLIAMLIPALVGFMHCLIPYLLVKYFVEKSFSRKVFWSSVKLLLGMVAMALFNMPFIWLFHDFWYPSWILAIGYYLFIPFFGYTAYMYVRNIKSLKNKIHALKFDLKPIIEKRQKLIQKIKETIPVA